MPRSRSNDAASRPASHAPAPAARPALATIVQTPLRDAAYAAVLDLIYRSDPMAATPLNDVELAAQLGISRTPVREALMRLSLEGILESTYGRGYAIRPLSIDDANDLYPILGALESLAVRSTRAFSATQLASLRSINLAMADERDSAKLVGIDRSWHETLIGAAANRHLLAQITAVRAALERYEYHYMGVQADVRMSTAHHRAIERALRKSDAGSAAALLEAHWRFGQERVVAALTTTTAAAPRTHR